MNIERHFPAGWRDKFSPNDRRIGMGLDLATTAKKKSNPSALAVTQQVGLSYFVRLLIRFKSSDPQITESILRYVIDGLPHGLKVRRLSVDATNERFWAAGVRTSFAGIVPVELCVSSEKTIYLGEEMSMKGYLGNLFINTIEDGYLFLPEEEWLRRDIRQVERVKGTFESDVAADGGHADCFDGIKLSLHSLISSGGPAQAQAAQVGTFGGQKPSGPWKNPYFNHSGTGASINV